MAFLEDLKYVRLYFSKNLHAKCYLNENKIIIASMNLYEFSQVNNREMGILIDTEDEEDRKVYEDATKDIESIIHNSEDFSYVKAPQKVLQSEKKYSPKKSAKSKTDFSKSDYKTTKELSQETELSSRKINSILVDKNLMYKKNDDWFATKKGKEFGGIEKEGQYGQFVIWPQEIKMEI
jgi:phosphatidylserine/phosphatidylglycerophosphate/cardiolipin synthase-like enzyme